MSRRELYAYTTKIYERQRLIKVGHCIEGRHEERINEQFGTSNPEKPIYRLIGLLPEGILDYNIHEQLKKNGIRKKIDSSGKEWFHATFEDVQIAYNDIVHRIHRKHNYSLRNEQQDAVVKATRWFQDYYSNDIYRSATYKNKFLLNAKMRFGKCFTGMHVAKSILAKRVLIVSYKPDVISEWVEVINEHIDFNDWIGIRAKHKKERRNDPCLSDDGNLPFTKMDNIAICVSLQDLSISASGITKKRLKSIPDVQWDLIIFDEVHYGSRTERAMHILNKLKYNKRLDLSGTPFRIIEQDDLCAQQVYTYSYLDEQANKKNEIKNRSDQHIYCQMPNLNICTIQITEEDIKQQLDIFKTDDVDYSLNRLFETREGKFTYEDSVDHFIEGLVKFGHEARSISVFGKLGQKLGVPAVRHSVWWLDRVDSINALATKLLAHPYFSKFEVINAAGSNVGKEDERFIAKEKSIIEDKINDVIRENKKLGTITLTCGRFLTGVTIKQWDSILVLNDVKSAESYFQAIFRVQSAWFDLDKSVIYKPDSWVFDFAINRCLRIIYDCADCIADQIDQQESYEQKTDYQKDNLEIVTSGLCDTLNIKRFFDGSLEYSKTTSKDIFEILNFEGSKISLARRITSNMLVNFNSLKYLESMPELLEILSKVKGYRTQDISFVEIKDLVEIGYDAEKLQEIKNDDELPIEVKEKYVEEFIEKDSDKERQKRKSWYATQIKRLAICMADFVYMTYEREYNLDDVINTKSPHFFEVMTGISKKDFNLLCENKFIHIPAMNRIVREFRDQEEVSLSPDKYILTNIRQIYGENSDKVD